MPAAWMRRGFAGETPRMKSPVEGMARMPAKAVMGWFSGTPGMERRPVALRKSSPAWVTEVSSLPESSTAVGPTNAFSSTVGETSTPLPRRLGAWKITRCTKPEAARSSSMYSPFLPEMEKLSSPMRREISSACRPAALTT